MFDDIGFLPFLFTVIAIIIAVKALNETAELRRRLNRMEAAALARPVPPPLPHMFEQGTAPTSPGVAAEPPPIAPVAEVLPAAGPQTDAPTETAAEPADGPPAAPPPPLPQPQPDPGFEETIGTRWVVWVGGLTLALGGIFMVRYSIEAGLLSDEVRVFLGGLFALALLAAGEWTRRKESISSIEHCRSPTFRRS